MLALLISTWSVAQPLPLLDAVQVNAFEFEGMTLVDPSEASRALATYTGHCLNILELQQATDIVADLYKKQGYFEVKVFLAEQDLEDGTINIEVVENSLQAPPVSDS